MYCDNSTTVHAKQQSLANTVFEFEFYLLDLRLTVVIRAVVCCSIFKLCLKHTTRQTLPMQNSTSHHHAIISI